MSKSKFEEGAPTEARSLLRRICPGREFSSGELEVANLVLSSFLGAGDRASRIPRRFVRVGEVYVKDGKAYRCVPRGEVSKVSRACDGCCFSKSSSPDRWCLGLQCSRWDRPDGENVWFVDEGECGD